MRKMLFVLFIFVLLFTVQIVSAESQSRENIFSSIIDSIKQFFSPKEEKILSSETPSFLEQKQSVFTSVEDQNSIKVPEELTPYVINYNDANGNPVQQTLYYDNNNELFWVETVSSSRRELVDKNGNVVEVQDLITGKISSSSAIKTIDLMRDQEGKSKSSQQLAVTGDSVASVSSQGASLVLATIIILASILVYGQIKAKLK